MPTAEAHANIALIKYWGKRELEANLPAAGSLSLTLEPLTTRTTVQVAESGRDRVLLNGAAASDLEASRVIRFLDGLVRWAGKSGRPPLEVVSKNAHPTGAGLASSASGFAALTVAAAAALDVKVDEKTLSEWARQGSGSAARSIFGGFVRMHRDGFAEPMNGLATELAAAVVTFPPRPKEVGSTDGMEHTRLTSPFHDAWVKLVEEDLEVAEAALRQGDFERLAEVVEGNCLAMHANAMAARPGVLYWEPGTLSAIQKVRSLRKSGVSVCFSIDAGPHVVAFAPPSELDQVVAGLEDVPGATLIRARSGGPARILDGVP